MSICGELHTDVKPLVPLLSSYRGYGKSQKARPHERGLKLDAEAALRHLLKRTDVNSSHIIVFGRSLGGAVAIHLVASYQDKVGFKLQTHTYRGSSESNCYYDFLACL